MEKLRLGIIGTGWPGQMHADAIRATGEAEVYACADVAPDRRDAFAKSYQTEKAYSDYAELLRDKAAPAVIICLPNSLHFPATLAALEAGKHVLCEKPPTLNAAEMKVLREEAIRRDLIYCFSRQGRFSPVMRMAKSLVEEGKLGRIYHARATFVRSRGIPVGIGNWFTEKQRSGGGALIDIGIHALDSIWYLLGTPRPVSVSAQVFRNFSHLVKVPIFDVEDSAYAFIRFENDIVAYLETSWAGNLTDEIPPRQYFGRELINSLVLGTKATIRLNPFALFEDRNGELVDVPLKVPTGGPNGFEFQLRSFLAAVRGDAAPINNADQAVALMEMLDAIYASSAAGREMPIMSI